MPTSDLYSAGATLYGLLTRDYVYDFPKRVELRILKILEEDPVPIRTRRPDLPASLAEMIDRSLAREPKGPFPGCGVDARGTCTVPGLGLLNRSKTQ